MCTRLPRPWDSLGKNTGVGCHFLLECMKVKSESEVAQSCPTLCDPMDCSLPGSSVHGIFQARVLEWGAIAFSELYSIFLQIEENFCLSSPRVCTLVLCKFCNHILLSHFSRVRLCATPDGSPPGSPVPGILQARTLEWVVISFSNA